MTYYRLLAMLLTIFICVVLGHVSAVQSGKTAKSLYLV